jgi:fructose transport system permease protein
VQHVLHAYPTIGPLVVLVLMLVAFSFASPRFLMATNWSLIIQQVMVLGTLAIGQTIIILTAGVDLSVGAIMVFTSLIMAKASATVGIPGPLALLLGFGVGAACGWLNGLLITRLRLPPFIVTLGTLNIFFALDLFISGSASVRGEDMDPILLWTGNTFSLVDTKVTYGSVMMLLLYAFMAYVLRYTGWGRHVYATGDDIEAARLSGIRTNRLLISVYLVAGVFYAMGAWFLLGRIGSASPQAGQTENLDSITAVVIGGTSLFGGRGSVIGTLIGALIVGVARNGLTLAGFDPLWQTFAVGVLVIVAVALDQWIRRVRA